MGLKLFRKARKRKQRGQTKAKRDLITSWEKMLKQFGGSPEEKVNRDFRPILSDPLSKVLAFNSDRTVAHVRSPSYAPIGAPQPRLKYTGKMAEREAKAQLEIEKKKKKVAIPYNKGGYQYIDGYDPKDLGKKT